MYLKKVISAKFLLGCKDKDINYGNYKPVGTNQELVIYYATSYEVDRN
jgi:hypothetical protein